MATAVQLPALSPTMTEGRITKWLKKEGDKISSGTAIAECETDKSNLEIEAYEDGLLLKILVPAGGTAPVGSTIAWIGKAGEKVPDAPPPAPVAAAPAPKLAAVPAAPVQIAAAPVAAMLDLPMRAPPPPAPRSAAAPVPPNGSNGRLRASPLARRIAADQGVDLAALQGSGPAGRVVRRDVEQALARGPMLRSRARSSERPVRVPPRALPLTQMRKVIAQRLTEVKPGVPHFYLQIEAEMDKALELREAAKAEGMKFSVNDIVVKAVANAVRRFPRINQSFAGDHLEQLENVDVGVAVAIEDGLITPVVRDADTKSFAEISMEVSDLAERARRKALKPEEYTGGSITVSNLGMFGIDSFVAVINPPQASILAIGKVEPRVVVRDGQMVIRQMMSATLSGDHRVIDGAVGAQYLKELKALLEQPLRLVL